MAKLLILVKAQQGWLGSDRIDSVPGLHVIIPSYEVDSLCLLVYCLYSKLPVVMRLVLRAIDRDSILMEPKPDRVEQGRTGF